MLKDTVDPVTQEKIYKLYYQVKGSYIPKSNWKGRREFTDLWIAAEDVTHTPPNVSALEPSVTAEEVKCDPINNQTAQDKGEKVATEIQKTILTMNKNLVQDLLTKGQIGQCLKDRQLKYPKNVKSPFAEYLKTHWQKKKPDTQLLLNGKKITRKQLFAIDALARTIMGEMRSCMKNGKRYGMSVAKVAINRAYNAQNFAANNKGRLKLPFVKDTSKGIDGKDFSYSDKKNIDEIITRVLSADSQFSAWNKSDNNSHLALCPKNLPHADEQAWHRSIEVAAAAILDKQNFAQQTEEVDHLYYTSFRKDKKNPLSELGKIPDWAKKMQVDNSVNVDGNKVNRFTCIMLWDELDTRGSKKRFKYQVDLLNVLYWMADSNF